MLVERGANIWHWVEATYNPGNGYYCHFTATQPESLYNCQGVDFAPGRRFYFSGVSNLCKIIGEITSHEAQFPLTSLVKSRMGFVLFVMKGMLSEWIT